MQPGFLWDICLSQLNRSSGWPAVVCPEFPALSRLQDTWKRRYGHRPYGAWCPPALLGKAGRTVLTHPGGNAAAG